MLRLASARRRFARVGVLVSQGLWSASAGVRHPITQNRVPATDVPTPRATLRLRVTW